jgi:hypothetical protein
MSKMNETKNVGNGQSTSLYTGEGVTQTWNRVLFENLTEKLDDSKLTAKMQAHFPERDYFQPVSRVRSFFNTGKYGFGLSPDYDAQGNVIKLNEMPKEFRLHKFVNGKISKGFGQKGTTKSVTNDLIAAAIAAKQAAKSKNNADKSSK